MGAWVRERVSVHARAGGGGTGLRGRAGTRVRACARVSVRECGGLGIRVVACGCAHTRAQVGECERAGWGAYAWACEGKGGRVRAEAISESARAGELAGVRTGVCACTCVNRRRVRERAESVCGAQIGTDGANGVKKNKNRKEKIRNQK